MIELMQLLGIQMSLASIVSLAAIVFFGLPHGAFDGAVALSLGFGKTPLLMLLFVLFKFCLEGFEITVSLHELIKKHNIMRVMILRFI